MDLTSLKSAFTQLPEQPEQVFLDHLAHFVPCMEDAANAFTRAGFTLTPLSAQNTQYGPMGTANRCVMLEEGYVELLTSIGEATALSQQMDAAISRYVGPHLLAFSTTDTAAKADALRSELVRLLRPVELTRRVTREDGVETDLRFTVQRLQPGEMPEGRMQYLTHHTPRDLWQRRYLKHENGAITLMSTLLGVADVQEAAHRFSRFFGRPEEHVPGLSKSEAVKFTLDRGKLTLANPQVAAVSVGGVPCPSIPCIPAYTLGFRDLAATVTLWNERGFSVRPTPCGGSAIDCAGATIIGFQG